MKVFLAALAALTSASTLQAAAINYTLSINDNGTGVYTPGSYAVYATTDSTNAGLAAYGVTLTGQSTVSNRAPQLTFLNAATDETAVTGFTFARAAQSATVTETRGAVYNFDSTGIPAYGIGQAAGNLALLAPTGYTASTPATQIVYGSPVLLITGTFASTPAITLAQGNVYSSARNNTTLTIDPAAIGVSTQTLAVPEPATIGLVAIAGLGMLARRRKSV